MCLSRSVFRNDLDALVAYGEGVDYFYFPPSVLQKIYLYHLARHDLSSVNIDEVQYHLESYADLRRDIYSDVHSLLKHVFRLLKIDIVLVGQYSYQRYQEVPSASKELGVPFYTLLKEGIVGKNQYDAILVEFNRRPYLGDFISVINEKMQKGLVEGNPGVKQDNSDVVGIPRFDFIVKNRNRMCFLTWQPKSKFFEFSGFFERDNAINSELMQKIEDVTFKFYEMVLLYFSCKPAEELIVKTKNALAEIEYVQNLCEKILGIDIPDNIRITNQGKAEDLIKEAGIVAGFNTTALVEALLYDKTVISPDYSDLLGDQSHEILADYNFTNLHRVKTEEEFNTILSKRKNIPGLVEILGRLGGIRHYWLRIELKELLVLVGWVVWIP